MNKELKISCFGEVLWDVFPEGEKIGGAPLNVAVRLKSLGVITSMLSCVGSDHRGEEIIKYLKNIGVDTSSIEIQSEYPTGIVQVSLDKIGSASYDIKFPVAWDKIPLTSDMIDKVEDSDAFIYGSLVCRDEISKHSLFELISRAGFKVLDVNLRQHYYEKNLLLELIHSADFIKFNDEELYIIAAMMGSTYNSLEQNLKFIQSKVRATSICVTKGRHGALLWHKNNYYYNSGFKIKVRDTVGAGDSFLAALLVNLLKDRNPQEALDYACGIGAMVAGQSGANPMFEEDQVQKFIYGKL